ncbi:lysoplasmalogenase [Chitinophaga rhizophila]|uniref:Lysoplasmalogenase n=1 Tax=Chitinophaga rhizophila TaxID=2866212 RepID=A0ABS7GF41_9BACT|nr:lysoplasmalogenase [Chitinophaga rhizophila]MBW8686302.1 lysoplasmalogenase [Chitinophaga rhizophila]
MQGRSFFNILYAVTLFVHLLAIVFHLDITGYASKFLLSFVLVVQFVLGTEGIPPVFRISMLAALFLTGFGDIFLLFSDQSPFFFTFGLATFALSLLAYIGFFLKIRYSNYPLPRCQWAFMFSAQAAIITFIYLVIPYLGQMTIPVIIFAIVASVMLQAVKHAFRLKDQPSGWYALGGAGLYILSCALIAIHHFCYRIPMGSFLIMLTYGLAQWGLVNGGLLYLRMRRGYAVQ